MELRPKRKEGGDAVVKATKKCCWMDLMGRNPHKAAVGGWGSGYSPKEQGTGHMEIASSHAKGSLGWISEKFLHHRVVI